MNSRTDVGKTRGSVRGTGGRTGQAKVSRTRRAQEQGRVLARWVRNT